MAQHTPQRNFRSANKELLVVSSKKTTATYGDKAFSVAASKLWNKLPLDIRSAKSVVSFKQQLKTHLLGKY